MNLNEGYIHIHDVADITSKMDWNADRDAAGVPWLDMPLNDGAAAAAGAATGDERRTEKGAMRPDRLHASSSCGPERLARVFCLHWWWKRRSQAK